jgi:hypothetical protein
MRTMELLSHPDDYRVSADALGRYLAGEGEGYEAEVRMRHKDGRWLWILDRAHIVERGSDGEPLRLSSGEAAIPIWGAYMGAIPHLRSEPAPPNGVTFRDIDPETGMLWGDGCPGPLREVFLDGTAPTLHCPTGLLGQVVRRVFFDRNNFDEPPAITLEKFREWANDVDRNRQQVQGIVDRLKRIFGR